MKKERNEMTYESDGAKARIKLMLDAIATRSMTADELTALTGIIKRSTTCYITHLKKTHKLHVSDWIYKVTEKRNTAIPLYRAGFGVDAPRPRALTAQQKGKRARDKLKTDDAAMRRALAARKRYRRKQQRIKAEVKAAFEEARRTARNFRPVMDPLTAALFGMRA